MSAPVAVRPARADDLPALLEIYNHYVRESHVTFDTEPATPESRREWIDGFTAAGPHRLLVAEREGRVAGYAYSAPVRPRAAYRVSAETTVYVAPDLTGRGIGQALYAELLDGLARDGGIHRAYGVIAVPNPASVALHERFGFRLVGVLSEPGFKFGRYWDVHWYERAF